MLIVEGSRVYYLPCSIVVLQIQHTDEVLPSLPQLPSLELPQTMTHSFNSIAGEGPEKSSQDGVDADVVGVSDPVEDRLRDLSVVIGMSREYV